MGVGLNTMQKLTGTLAGAALAIAKTKDTLSKDTKVDEPKQDKKSSGIDAKMAAKARRVAQQKINAIYANKEISGKAKTRRIGKVLDEMGGNK